MTQEAINWEEITWEQVKELIPDTVSLNYVDYRESLDESAETIQECISEGEWYPLYDKIDEWYQEQRWFYEGEYLKELQTDLENEFEIEDGSFVTDKFEGEIRETLWDRDDSDVLSDLIRNTSTLVAHYDTGYEMESGSWNWSEAEVRLERIHIKKHLGILNTTEYDAAMDMMIMQASYGGQLLIYFNLDIEDFVGHFPNRKTIKFKNAQIGVVDHYNGSGDILEMPISQEIVLPYNPENVFLEESIKYNWTYSIAGMTRDWADSTEIAFTEEEVGEIKTSSTNDHLKQEEQYNKTYREGGCTFGDMDYRRHRNTVYINDYPCGNKCKDCGTFWID